MKENNNIGKNLAGLLAAAGVALIADSSVASIPFESSKQIDTESSTSAFYWEIEADNCENFTPDSNCRNSHCR